MADVTVKITGCISWRGSRHGETLTVPDDEKTKHALAAGWVERAEPEAPAAKKGGASGG